MGKAKEGSIMDYLFHVGNAGVILKLGGQWVGIDVFTGREIKPYQPLPETLEQKLLCDAGCPEIGLLVVTHSHRDHFHPQKVSAYGQIRCTDSISAVHRTYGQRLPGRTPLQRTASVSGAGTVCFGGCKARSQAVRPFAGVLQETECSDCPISRPGAARGEKVPASVLPAGSDISGAFSLSR